MLEGKQGILGGCYKGTQSFGLCLKATRVYWARTQVRERVKGTQAFVYCKD